MRVDAKNSLNAMRRVLKLMDSHLTSDNADRICVASAFLQILKHHMEDGDLRPDNVILVTMLRGDSPGVNNE